MNSFHPDGLPNTGSTGIVTAIRSKLQVLLSAGLMGTANITFHIHHQVVCLTGLDIRRNIYLEGRSSTKVTGSKNTVDVDLRLIINCTEVQQYLFVGPVLWNGDRPVIPHVIDKVFVFNSRQFTFRAERNDDLLIESGGLEPFPFQTGTAEVE